MLWHNHYIANHQNHEISCCSASNASCTFKFIIHFISTFATCEIFIITITFAFCFAVGFLTNISIIVNLSMSMAKPQDNAIDYNQHMVHTPETTPSLECAIRNTSLDPNLHSSGVMFKSL